MFNLDQPTRKLEVILAGSVTTNQLQVVAGYHDISMGAGSEFLGNLNTNTVLTNNTTAVTVVPAPTSAVNRLMRSLNINNTDTANATVTIRYNDNGTIYTLLKLALASGETATYEDTVGWRVYTSTGVLKSTLTQNNIAATDPTVSNDNTQGYSPLSMWVNTTNGRVWTCQSAATGAAAWALAIVPGTGVEPANNLEQFGAGTATMLSEGNVYRVAYSAAAATQPGATGVDSVLAVYTLPANSFDQAGRGLSIQTMGAYGATGNNKDVKIIFNPTTAVVGSTVGTGGTTIADTGVVATNGGGWELCANIFKIGAANSNTQYAQATAIVNGAVHAGISGPFFPTAVENAPILIAVTGNATTAVTDIKLNFLEINAMN